MSRSSVESVFTCVDCYKEFEEERKMNIHLKKVHKWTDEEVENGSKEYEVEEIISHRYDKESEQYLYTVKWKGYDEPSEIAKDGFGEESDMLAEYKVNNLFDDSRPPNRKRKSKKPEEQGDKAEDACSLRPSIDRSSPVPAKTPKKDTKDKTTAAKKKKNNAEELLFFKNHKMHKVLGFKSTPETGILYLVEFIRKEDETADHCRLVRSDDLWKKRPDMLRSFFEEQLANHIPSEES